MGKKIEGLALDVEMVHFYRWYCPQCFVRFIQDGGKKIGFLIALTNQHGVKKVDGKFICGECAKNK